MKTIEVEIALMQYIGVNKYIIVPNVTHISGLVDFEVDLLSLSKQGYASRFEIKVSHQDLVADFKNIRHNNGLKKYTNLKYFSYAFPEEMLSKAEKLIDNNFGIYIIKKHNLMNNYFYVVEHRKPKIINNTKWSYEMQLKLAHLGCMRILNHKKTICRR